MKIQNVLKKTLLCAALTALPLISSLAAAGEGGLSGGGGGTTQRYNDEASAADIRLALDNAKMLLQMRVADFQDDFFEAYHPEKNWVDLKDYFYPNADRLLTTIRNTKVVIQNAPCSHPSQPGKNLEGAAFPETKTICLSLQAIEARKHARGAIAQKVVGLLAHEIYHIMNPSQSKEVHDSATNFQTTLESSLTNTNLDELMYDLRERREDSFTKALDAAEMLKFNQNQFDLASFCSQAVLLATDPEDARFENFEDQYDGLNVNTPRMKSIDKALNQKFFNFASICFYNGVFKFRLDDRTEASVSLTGIFKNETSLSIVEYSRRFQKALMKAASNIKDPPSPKERQQIEDLEVSPLTRFGMDKLIVRNLSRDNKELIAAEIQETLSLLNQYAQELKKLPAPVGYNK